MIYEVRDNGNLKYFTKINEIEPLLKILKVSESKIKKYKKIGNGQQKNIEIKNIIGDTAL